MAMNVNLNINGKTYPITLHDVNLWEHSAEMPLDEITALFKEVLADNPALGGVWTATGGSNG